jgi:dienelactone hydrolase
MTRLLVRMVVLLVAAPLLVACDTAGNPGPRTSAAPSSTPTPTPTGDGVEHRSVEFPTRDGQRRAGRLFGDGTTAVVLSHMGSAGASQNDWTAFAEELARQGYQALTYERRETLREVWHDVLAAADYLRTGGAERVVAAGASIGAMASLHAATQPDNGLHGVIWLAGVIGNRHYEFQQGPVAAVTCPILLISGDKDAYAAAADARRLHDWAKGASELLILPSARHGTEILTEADPNAEKLMAAMTAFIRRVSTGNPVAC